MASFFNKSMVVFMAVVLLFLGTATKAQNNTPSCASKLVPCANYLNSTTTPPDTCCNSIKEAVTSELSCLCNLYNTPGLLQSLGVNVTQAVQLTQRCGVNADLSACSRAADAPTGATPPPPVPGNDGSKMAWTGFSSLLLLLASLSLY